MGPKHDCASHLGRLAVKELVHRSGWVSTSGNWTRVGVFASFNPWESSLFPQGHRFLLREGGRFLAPLLPPAAPPDTRGGLSGSLGVPTTV